MGAAIYPPRVAATLVGIVGAMSLLLSATGLYSVLSFALNQRTHEFGIRIALGALVVLKVSTAFLPKMRTDAPAIFGGAILLLALAGSLASCLPARRATRVDPIVSLGQE